MTFQTCTASPTGRKGGPPGRPACARPIDQGAYRERQLATRKRKGISKSVRFEVFKRDSFTCQYCGAKAPDVLLELDHIQPVSKDGDSDVMNLVTACKPCNLGKSDRELDDDSVIRKQQAQLEELNARREQLEMMLTWREGMKDLQGEQLEIVLEAWSQAATGWSLNDIGRKEAEKLLKRFGLQSMLDAIDVAQEAYIRYDADGKATQDSVNLGWRKLGGICAVSAMPPAEKRLRYVTGILRKRLMYVPYDVLRTLRSAHQAGVDAEAMVEEAKYCKNWTEFSSWLYEQMED